ncbi:MAG: hypothetical protein ACLFWM_04040 [Actinomycetota bacterium]
MHADSNNQMDPQAALDRAQRVGDTVRRRGRWHGWVWLTMGLITPVFLIGANVNSVPGATQFWIAIGFMTVGGVLAVWETRRGVWSREAVKADRPFTWAYMTGIVAFAVPTIILDPIRPPAWLVALALLPSIPCFLAAWRILTR